MPDQSATRLRRRRFKSYREPVETVDCLACGGVEHDYELTMFPLAWRAKCRSCGMTERCEMAPSKPRPKPAQKPSGPDPSQGYDHGMGGWPYY